MTKFLTILALALLPTPAFAEPAEPVISIVQIADLDLASSHGQRTLDKRLSQAVVEVCGEASPADLTGQNKVRSCRVETRTRYAAERNQRIAAASTSPIQVAAR